MSEGFEGRKSVIFGASERRAVGFGFAGAFFSIAFSGVDVFGLSHRATRSRVAGCSRNREEARRFSGTTVAIMEYFESCGGSRADSADLWLGEGWVGKLAADTSTGQDAKGLLPMHPRNEHKWL